MEDKKLSVIDGSKGKSPEDIRAEKYYTLQKKFIDESSDDFDLNYFRVPVTGDMTVTAKDRESGMPLFSAVLEPVGDKDAPNAYKLTEVRKPFFKDSKSHVADPSVVRKAMDRVSDEYGMPIEKGSRRAGSKQSPFESVNIYDKLDLPESNIVGVQKKASGLADEAISAVKSSAGDVIDAASRFAKGPGKKIVSALPYAGTAYGLMSGDPASAAEESVGDIPIAGQIYETIKPDMAGSAEDDFMMKRESDAYNKYKQSPASMDKISNKINRGPASMATDPTQPLRQALVPSSSGLGMSMANSAERSRQQLAADEANNLVMQKEPVVLPPEAEAFTNAALPQRAPAAPTDVSKYSLPQEAAPATTSGINAPATTSMANPFQESKQDQDTFNKIAAQQDAFLKQEEARMIERNKAADAEKQRIADKLNEIESKPFQFDNRSLWAKSSSGEKVALLLGAFLSSASPQSAKAFQEGIQRTIDNDLALQNKMFDEQKGMRNTLLWQLRQITNNKDAANEAFRAIMLKGIGDKLQLQMQRSQSELQRKQAAIGYQQVQEELALKKADMMAKIGQKALTGSIPGYEGRITDEVAGRDFAKQVTAKDQAFGEINNLLSINKKGLASSFSPSDRASAQQSQTLLQGQLREILVGPGAVSEGERELLKEAIANPTDFFSLKSSNEIKLNKLKKAIENKVNATAKIYGLKRVGEEIGTKKGQ